MLRGAWRWRPHGPWRSHPQEKENGAGRRPCPPHQAVFGSSSSSGRAAVSALESPGTPLPAPLGWAPVPTPRSPFLKMGGKKKTQKKPQTNGEFSPASAFSDNSSCASAGPGRGSVPVNRPKPSAIQIACGAAAGTTGCSCGRDAVPSWLHAPSSPGMKEGRCRMFSQLFLSLSRLPEVGEAIKRKEVEKGRCWCPDPAVRGRMGQADPQWPNPC